MWSFTAGRTLFSAALAALALAAAGCWLGEQVRWEDGGPADDPIDSDGTDPAGGGGGDGVVGENGHCWVQPYTCADLGSTYQDQVFGCCFGFVAYWCEYDATEQWTLYGMDCAFEGQICEIHGDDGAGCY